MQCNRKEGGTFSSRLRTALLVLCLMTGVQAVMAQDVTVSGVVKDETNQPMPGATVVVKGTPRGVTTDVDGTFTLSVKPTDVLEVTFVGYQPVTHFPNGIKKFVEWFLRKGS